MKTDDLIAALSADTPPASPPISRTLLLATGAGLAVSLVVLLATIGVRGDVMAALATWRFDLKIVLLLLALGLALADCITVARPEVRTFASRASLLVPAILVAAVIVELFSVPSAAWGRRLVGTNGMFCLVWIPLLALVPLALGMWAMRSGAPSSAAGAGAAVGRLAAAAGAALYAWHCFDDSPLFVATWYTLATAIVVAAGAAMGSRLLRW